MDFIFKGIENFYGFLDWVYIISVIIILHITDPRKQLYKGNNKAIKWIGNLYADIQPTIRVFIIGSIYGTLLFYVRGLDSKAGLESFMVSLLFTMIAHKVIIKNVVKYFVNAGTGKSKG